MTTTPAPSPTPAPTPTPAPASNTISSSSSASYTSAGAYTYTSPSGIVYDNVIPSWISGNFLFNSSDLKGVISVGGTTYSYARFGTWASKDGTITDAFHMGTVTPTTSVPTTGTATYTGYAVRTSAGDGYSNLMSYAVDFGGKTITGTSTAVPVPEFGNTLGLAGTISGNAIAGTATSGTSTGKFTGNFYGPAATELAGIASFSTTSLNAAFGGKK